MIPNVDRTRMTKPSVAARALRLLLVLALAAVAPISAPSNVAATPLSPSRQVERLYRAYFDRAPDAEGHSFWTQEVLNGQPLAVVSDAFAQSPEFDATYGALPDTDFVDLVYNNVLSRAPDSIGSEFWTGQLATRTRGDVMVGFSESAEFAIRLGHLDGEQVSRLYQAYFLREGDAQGLSYWQQRQMAGFTLIEISETFARSPEFSGMYGALSNRDFVTLVYQNVLGRLPDAEGLGFWTSRLDQRVSTRGAVMVGFSESPEFSGNPAPPSTAGRSVGGCQLFPSDSFWFRSVADLPIHPSSDAFVNTIGRDRRAHPDFGSDYDGTGAFGIPYETVRGPGPSTVVTFDYDEESDPSPYPIPADTPIERGSDAHILVVETGRCVLHEIFAAEWVGNSIRAGSGARWDLSSNAMRPDGWTSGDAAGLPILPGLVRYDEVAAGSVDHVIRFTAPVTDDSYVWPASHHAGRDGIDHPPMGSWMRLKASVDPGDFDGQARVIVEALLEHGAILADNGSSWYLSGAPDTRWDNDDLGQLKTLNGSMFEFVDASSLQVAPNSMASR
ncbi:MAG: hypothetical protein ACI8TP_001618 [Acidimicrobiales bacterium]|jgi:hypothetical protein